MWNVQFLTNCDFFHIFGDQNGCVIRCNNCMGWNTRQNVKIRDGDVRVTSINVGDNNRCRILKFQIQQLYISKLQTHNDKVYACEALASLTGIFTRVWWQTINISANVWRSKTSKMDDRGCRKDELRQPYAGASTPERQAYTHRVTASKMYYGGKWGRGQDAYQSEPQCATKIGSRLIQ